MDRLRAWLEQNRRIALPALAVVVAVVVFWAFSRILGGPAAEEPAPPAPAPAAPAPVAPPAAEQPAPAAPQVPGGSVVLAGRSDPFAPLVTEPRAAPSRPGPSGGPTPLPPPPLPLPPLPPGPGAAPGTPGAPGGPQAQPAPPPPPEAGITVLGIISDAKSLVIVSISGKTEILFEGEAAGDLRVIKIDAVRGVVTFERAGKRFDLKIGGG
jgi:hypothetical protein